MKNNLMILLTVIPTITWGQWSATQIAGNTFNSTLRPMSQGVYDHYSDKSFFCFMQENSNPYVVECDHSSGQHTWGTPQLVFNQSKESKYNYPTIDILPDRRLVLSYASPFDDALGFAISDSPADPTSWTNSTVDVGTLQHVEYPRIKVDRRGHIYLFYIHMDDNHAAHKRWYYYVKSEDGGQSWSTPTLSLQRELDDPYGMCEMYVGYTVEEPYRQGEPERWWFAFTSSSGFQYEGIHTGNNNSANLIDTTANWGSGENFTYRWVYNISKGLNSGISSANYNIVYPTNSMDWDNGDAYGIAYHNIYHSDIFVVYFRPDNGHWYDAAHNDLGETVSRNEMETPTARAYSSPKPPSSKNVGYVPELAVNNQGYPVTFHNDIFYVWNGIQWNQSDAKIPSGYFRYFYFTEGNYYILTNRLAIYNSNDLENWTNVGSTSLPNTNNFGIYSVFVQEGHAEAIVNVHEYIDDLPGNAWGISAGEKQVPEALLMRTSNPYSSTSDSSTVYVYLTDKVHGARSRVRNATNEITLSVLKGNATILTPTLNAVNGLAEFSVTINSTSPEMVILEAVSAGLDSCQLNLYVKAGTISKLPILKDNFLKVFPNPSGGLFTIELNMDKPLFIRVYNILGDLVYCQNKADKNGQIDLSHYKKGLYILEVNVKDEMSFYQSIFIK